MAHEAQCPAELGPPIGAGTVCYEHDPKACQEAQLRAAAVEVGCGVAAVVLGIPGWAWALFGPTYVPGTYDMGGAAPPVVLPNGGSLVEVWDIGSGPIVY